MKPSAVTTVNSKYVFIVVEYMVPDASNLSVSAEHSTNMSADAELMMNEFDYDAGSLWAAAAQRHKIPSG